jgi:hypothetical protein
MTYGLHTRDCPQNPDQWQYLYNVRIYLKMEIFTQNLILPFVLYKLSF